MNNMDGHKPDLMRPKIAVAFKLIFGNEKHKDITIAFLSDVLNMPRQKLVDGERPWNTKTVLKKRAKHI